MTSNAIAPKDRRLKRDSETFSMESATSCGARAAIRERRLLSMRLSQVGKARVAAGTAAFCMNGAKSIN